MTDVRPSRWIDRIAQMILHGIAVIAAWLALSAYKHGHIAWAAFLGCFAIQLLVSIALEIRDLRRNRHD